LSFSLLTNGGGSRANCRNTSGRRNRADLVAGFLAAVLGRTVVDEKWVAVVDWTEPLDVLLDGRWVFNVGLFVDGLVEERWVVGGRTVVIRA
jgi:hypothetical protein